MIKYDSSNDVCYMLGRRICEALSLPVEREEDPDIFAGGSQLASSSMDFVNGKRPVFIWGCGYLRNPTQYNKTRLIRILRNKEILAVSGNLTKEYCESLGYFPSYAVVGNLYLLTKLIFPVEGTALNGVDSIEAQSLPEGMTLESLKDNVLIVSDNKNLTTLKEKFPAGANFLSTNSDTMIFLKVLTSASQVLTTSASVLAIAHSYGIPAGYLRVEPFKKNDRIFEIEDYYSQFNEDFTVFTGIKSLAGNAITCPSESKIEAIQKNLLVVLPESLTNYKVSKLMAENLGVDDNIEVPAETASGKVNVKISLDNGMTFIDWVAIKGEQILNNDAFAITDENPDGLPGFNERVKDGYFVSSADVIKLSRETEHWERNQKFHFENGIKVVLNFSQDINA